jgi:hypothetical protein
MYSMVEFWLSMHKFQHQDKSGEGVYTYNGILFSLKKKGGILIYSIT